MQPNELADAIAVLLKGLREQLATIPGSGAETLGVMQARLLRGYLEEYVALEGDPVLSGVLRDFPDRPTLHDAVSVLEQMARGARPSAPTPPSRDLPTVDRSTPPTETRLGPTLADEMRTKVLQPLGTAIRGRFERILHDLSKGPALNRSQSDTPIRIASPGKSGFDSDSHEAENAFEAEKQMWLATIPQERGTFVDDQVALKSSDVNGLVRLRRIIGVLNVGLAAALATGAPAGLLSISGWHGGDWALLIGTALFWMFIFDAYIPWIKKWAGRWRVKRGLPPLPVRHPHYPIGERIPGRIVVAFLVGFAVEALLHVSGEATARPALLTAVPFVAIVTWFWIRGTEAQPQQASVLGAKSGVIVGCLIGYIAPLIWAPEQRTDVTLRFILMFGLRGGLLGFAGGLALDRGWGAQPRGMLKSLLVAALVWYLMIAPLGFGATFADYVMTLLTALTFAAGWAIGVSDWQLRSPLQALALRRAPLGEAAQAKSSSDSNLRLRS